MSRFLLFLALAGTASASVIVNASPSTSPAYPVGTFFEPGEVSATTDPLGPFSDIPIQFEGYSNGGSQVSLHGGACSNANPCEVFLYNLTFPTLTTINSIVFTGDAFNGAVFELLNSSNGVLDTLSVSSGNVGHNVTYTLLTPGASGTSFGLELFDTSTFWTFVNNIQVNAAPEPATSLLVLASLGVIAWTQRKRSRS